MAGMCHHCQRGDRQHGLQQHEIIVAESLGPGGREGIAGPGSARSARFNLCRHTAGGEPPEPGIDPGPSPRLDPDPLAVAARAHSAGTELGYQTAPQSGTVSQLP